MRLFVIMHPGSRFESPAGFVFASSLPSGAELVGIVHEDGRPDRVGIEASKSPTMSCHLSTGTWLVTTVELDAVAVLEDCASHGAVSGDSVVERGQPPIIHHQQPRSWRAIRAASGSARRRGQWPGRSAAGTTRTYNAAVSVAAGAVGERASYPLFPMPVGPQIRTLRCSKDAQRPSATREDELHLSIPAER